MTQTVMRFFDLVLSILGMLLLSPIFVTVLLLGWLDTGSPVFRQSRMGLRKIPFVLYKFRTMRPETPDVASHLADPNSITTIGRLLRISKADELPQLINVIVGDMSLVGPRPNLFDQHELTSERDKRGVYNVRPGITGLAQIAKIDMSTPELLATVDKQMIDTMSMRLFFYCLFKTVTGSGRGDAAAKTERVNS